MVWRVLFTVIIFAVSTAQLHAAGGGGVYSWTDEEGNIHYGNKPPEGREKEAVAATLSRYDSTKLVEKLKQATASAKTG